MTAADICAPLRNGSWSQGGISAFTVPFTDPGGEVARIVGWALDYLSPLNEWVNDLTGNESQVDAFGSTWRGVASALDGFEAQLADSARRLTELEGRTARALRKRHDEIRIALTDASEWTTATAAALELASTIVGAVHDAVVGAIAELAGLIATLFGPTLNPFDQLDQLRRLSNRAVGFIEVVAELIQRMFDAFEQLVALLQSLVPLIQEGLLELRYLLGSLLRDAGIASGLIGPAGGPLNALIGGILGGAASDLLAEDARVTELDPSQLSPDQYKAWVAANGVQSIDSLSDLITANGQVDSMGGGDRSVIDIMEVEKDGKTHWIVAMPSTQDWGLLKGMFPDGKWEDMLSEYPATNDLDSNVALMLMDNPWMATQYERAVMTAMSDAGIPEGADVVYTGFSQGGIMAANLASDPDSPYNVIGIVTNGSPIDKFDIPPSVQVVSFEHRSDPVPHLDLDPVPQDHTDNRGIYGYGTGNPYGSTTTAAEPIIHLPNPVDAKGNELSDVGSTHDNDNYAASVAAWEAAHPDEIPDFYSGEIVNHQQHTWGE